MVNWTPLTDWMQATKSPMLYLVTNTAGGSHSYRVQVRP
jgi:hypothetical protein